MRRLWIPVLALLLLAALPEAGHACSVCFSATDENRAAFLITTGFLTLLPLGMVAGTGLWFKRRVRQIELSDQDDGESSEA
jgi:hypothetical protein